MRIPVGFQLPRAPQNWQEFSAAVCAHSVYETPAPRNSLGQVKARPNNAHSEVDLLWGRVFSPFAIGPGVWPPFTKESCVDRTGGCFGGASARGVGGRGGDGRGGDGPDEPVALGCTP